MSVGIYIPKEYAWDSAKGTWKDPVRLLVKSKSKGGEITVDISAEITIIVPHHDGQPGVEVETTLDLYPRMSMTSLNIIDGFHFSGFRASCNSIIKTLGMPEDTVIY